MTSRFKDDGVFALLNPFQDEVDQLFVVRSGRVSKNMLAERQRISWREKPKAPRQQILPKFRAQ